MPSRAAVGLTATAAIALLVGGCARDLDPLGPASFPPDPAIFIDGFGAGVGFAAFGGSKADAVDIDQVVRYTGDAALQITIPDFGDPTGSYAGGAFVTNTPRDLSGFNALTFWARASRNLTLDVAGLGNDNTGTSMFSAETSGLAVTTTWSKFVVPIPDASRLEQERGLFFFAEGPENQQGAILWVDELQYEQVSGLSAPRPAINTQSIRTEVGGSAQVAGTRATYTFDGRDVTVGASASYFTYASSDPGVATVDEMGVITVVSQGIATITAALNGVQAEGAVEVRTALPPQGPAPTPTQDAANVISLFSDAYDDVAVDTWRTSWSNATLEDVTIGGNATKKYTNLGFAGIETVSQQIDISEMTHISMDFYTPDETPASAEFR
ncbi:MAG: Ig-like domain-containing protein, partial [Gemmatimonadetes bacterium]|nr:Ig-like domain-containing protein [Gemmatimonadota bacterium]